ncbi:hypothetical protein PG993_014437 [Apiospora rasikravindrae]|uniref:NmrA-like domain-containing protein n=1 Tax=Apiospora rasikravindrae TaxID=990691 RepID=A0ABR1RPS5_9PEZI
MSNDKRLIAVIGGTGAQGIPIVRDLAPSGSYELRGTFASEADLRSLFLGAWGAFVNIDGFNNGEKTEIFWTMRAYELAAEAGVEMFVYGALDYYLKKAGYDSAFRTGHADAKGRMADWILAQTREDASSDGSSKMKAGCITPSWMKSTLTASGAPRSGSAWRSRGHGGLGQDTLCERVQSDRLVPVLKVAEEGGARSL